MDMPDEYLTEIGRIVVCWNSLEHMLDAALIVALSGKPQDPDGRASAIFAHMAIEQKINALESMLRLIDKTPGGMGDIFQKTQFALPWSNPKTTEMQSSIIFGWATMESSTEAIFRHEES